MPVPFVYVKETFVAHRTVIVLLLAILLASCSSNNRLPAATATPEAYPAAAYPTPGTASNPSNAYPYPYPYPQPQPTLNPYPYPAAQQTVSTPEPTVDAQQQVSASTGAVLGVLSDLDGQPIVGLRIFLAVLTPGPAQNAPVISFTLSSPSGGTDATGRFVIGNLEPGTYSLAYWTPASSGLIPAPSGEKDSAIQIEVRSNQVSDIGTVRIRRP